MRRTPSIFSLVASLTLIDPTVARAYGGWETSSLGGMLMETMQRFLPGVVFIGVVPYIICSVLLEKVRLWATFIVVFAYLAWTFLFVFPNLHVMGEFGPAHVASPFTGVAVMTIFPALLVTKWAILVFGARDNKTNPADG